MKPIKKFDKQFEANYKNKMATVRMKMVITGRLWNQISYTKQWQKLPF